MARDEDEPRPRNYVRAWREYRRLTQAQLAAIIGTEGSVISLLESGDRGLSDKWLRRLAVALNATPTLLLDFHPDNVDRALVEMWTAAPEEKRLSAMTRFMADTSPGKPPEPPPETLQGDVVAFPKPRRERSEDRASKSHKRP